MRFKLEDFEKKIITPQILYSEISDFDIFNSYIDNFQIGKAFKSPLRKDEHPSFTVYMSKKDGLLFYHDFGTGESGDAIKFVKRLYNLTYYEAMSKLMIEFGKDKKYYCKYSGALMKDVKYSGKKYIHPNPKKKTLRVKIRKMKDHDRQFWNSFGISEETLRVFNVFPISHFEINSKTFVADTYAYVFVEEKDDKITYKIYQPKSILRKWFSSHDSSVHQGYTQLPEKGKLLIITKSLKDVMSIYELTGLPSVGIQSETVVIKDKVMKEYKSRFNTIVGLFDNDETGKRCAERYKKLYNIPTIFIPSEIAKDFSDAVLLLGPNDAKKLLLNLLNYLQT